MYLWIEIVFAPNLVSKHCSEFLHLLSCTYVWSYTHFSYEISHPKCMNVFTCYSILLSITNILFEVFTFQCCAKCIMLSGNYILSSNFSISDFWKCAKACGIILVGDITVWLNCHILNLHTPSIISRTILT